MKPQKYQYAQLPRYAYQSFERQYQTFDRNTLSFSYYPIIHSTTDRLTEGKVQDDKGPSAAEPEEKVSAETKVEEPSESPNESPASPEPAGMYQNMNHGRCIHIQERWCISCAK